MLAAIVARFAIFQAVPTWVWKMVAVLAILMSVFLYGYTKGKGVERARCEAAAQRAQEAANTQDREADRQVQEQDQQTVTVLTQQKAKDDEVIRQLEAKLAAAAKKKDAAGNPCVYDRSNADPDDPPRRVRP